MKITLVTVGKIKERFFADAIKEYEKRLSRYCRLGIVQVADEKTPEKASEAKARQIREREGERILAQLKEGAYVIALAIEGKMASSEELAKKLEKLGITGKSQVVFVIGGSLGLSEAVLKRADEQLSFSRMTFSPSADEGDSSGADLPELSDYCRRTVSQVREVTFNRQFQ